MKYLVIFLMLASISATRAAIIDLEVMFDNTASPSWLTPAYIYDNDDAFWRFDHANDGDVILQFIYVSIFEGQLWVSSELSFEHQSTTSGRTFDMTETAFTIKGLGDFGFDPIVENYIWDFTPVAPNSFSFTYNPSHPYVDDIPQLNGTLLSWDAGSEGGGFLWQTYEPKEVSEPSILAIFALGIMGLCARRFKKSVC